MNYEGGRCHLLTILYHSTLKLNREVTQPMPDKSNQQPQDKYDIELPQSIIDSFARFLVPEIRKFYESEEGQRALAEWQDKQQE